jgi:hypothetical protein
MSHYNITFLSMYVTEYCEVIFRFYIVAYQHESLPLSLMVSYMMLLIITVSYAENIMLIISWPISKLLVTTPSLYSDPAGRKTSGALRSIKMGDIII